MKKISLILGVVLLSAISVFAQPNNNTETSKITKDEFNQETYGIRANVIKKSDGKRIPLQNALRLDAGDELKIIVNREVNGTPMKRSGKKWHLAVIFFSQGRTIDEKNVLVRELSKWKDDFEFTFKASQRVIPIIFLVTGKGYEKELVKAVGTEEGKEAIENLSKGLNKYSTLLEKIQRYAEITKNLLEEPPAIYKTEDAFNERLKNISKIFNIVIPPVCEGAEFEKQLTKPYTLTDWRLKKADCIASNVDISKFKINWLAAGKVVVSELKREYAFLDKYSGQFVLAVELVTKFISWYQNRRNQIKITAARFKQKGSDEYQIFTQKSVVVNGVEFAVMITPIPVDNLRIETSLVNMKAALLEKDLFSVGNNVFGLWDNDLVTNNSVRFFLEIGNKKLPLERIESGDEVKSRSSFSIDIKQEDLPTDIPNGKVKAKIVGEYDSDKKIVSNEMELTISIPN